MLKQINKKFQVTSISNFVKIYSPLGVLIFNKLAWNSVRILLEQRLVYTLSAFEVLFKTRVGELPTKHWEELKIPGETE